MRIAIGGFQHETNTFAPSKATFENFQRGEGWPPLLQGDDVIEGTAGINLPLAGFVEQIKHTRHQLVPTAWAAASPSAHVTEDAFEKIAAMIIERIKSAGDLDAVYLDLHGAMVTEHLDDGEGFLLERVRAVVGPNIPVVASLDLHANVTQRMLKHADILIAYRTYPHVDMAETGARVASFLTRRLNGAPRPAVSSQRIPFLIPLQAQSTMLEPNKSLYEELARIEDSSVTALSFTPGFPAADFSECGPTVFAYAENPDSATRVTQQLARIIEEHEARFDSPVYSPAEGVRRAIAVAANASKPVVIADTQDNPGAGGNSDTMGMLRALVGANAQHAALGLIIDPEVARAAHTAGEGAHITVKLGGKSGIAGDAPFEERFFVERLSDGKFTCTGPFYRGTRMELGPSACLRIGGIRIAVACKKVQLADQEMYRSVGIEPTREKILVVKSSVHFRADFAPIAEEILVCASPGPMLADPTQFAWKKLRDGLRLKPRGPAFNAISM